MGLKRMDNVGIVVDDLGATIDFFLELGLELEGRATIEGEWAGRVTGLSDQRVEIAMMRTPDGHARLELSRQMSVQIDRDGLTFGRTPQTIRRPGTVTARNRRCLLQKEAFNLPSLTGRQHWLADRRTGGKHRSSERPPLSATEWSANWTLRVRGGSGLWLDAYSIVDRVADPLLATEIAFGCLHRNMSKEELNLV